MSQATGTEQAHTYLALFLPEPRADALSRAAAEEAGPGSDRAAVLAAAHRRLRDEVRLSDAVAAQALVEEAGLPPEEAADVLGVPTERVVAAVEEARAIAQELGVATTSPEPPAGPSPDVQYVFDTEAGPHEPETAPGAAPGPLLDGGAEPARRRRGLTVLVGLIVLVAVVLAIVMSTGSGEADVDPADGDVAGRVTITDARTTDLMGPDGPGAPRDVFEPQEAVIFWFAYEPLDGEAVVELVLTRDGEELITPSFPLSQSRTEAHVTLPRAVTDDPGSYTIELRREGRTLVETGFEIAAQ